VEVKPIMDGGGCVALAISGIRFVPPGLLVAVMLSMP